MAVKRSTSIGANEPINPSMARRLGFHLIVVGPIITNKHLPLVVLPLTVVAMNAPPCPVLFIFPIVVPITHPYAIIAIHEA